MLTAHELDLSYLLTPRPGPGVCPECFNLMSPGFARCRACAGVESHLDLLVPISYSIALGRLHFELADYKRTADPSVPPITAKLAAILDGFVARHEPCVARAAGVGRFDVITTVPSNRPERAGHHPLNRIVGELCAPTRDRYRPLLRRSDAPLAHRTFDRRRFTALEPLGGSSVLLIDDTWTTGASAQSAAFALRAAGASRVAAVVIGRHLNSDWSDAAERIEALAKPFDPEACVLCIAPRAGHADHRNR
jgi:predicted amidophosphoribosyltransferase